MSEKNKLSYSYRLSQLVVLGVLLFFLWIGVGILFTLISIALKVFVVNSLLSGPSYYKIRLYFASFSLIGSWALSAFVCYLLAKPLQRKLCEKAADSSD